MPVTEQQERTVFVRNVFMHVLEAFVPHGRYAEIRDASYKPERFEEVLKMSPYNDHGLVATKVLKLAKDLAIGLDVPVTADLRGNLYCAIDSSDSTYGKILDIFIQAMKDQGRD